MGMGPPAARIRPLWGSGTRVSTGEPAGRTGPAPPAGPGRVGSRGHHRGGCVRASRSRARAARLGLALLVLLGGMASSPAPRAAECVAPPEGPVPTWELEGHPELGAMAPTIRAILERNHARYPSPNGVVEGYDA